MEKKKSIILLRRNKFCTEISHSHLSFDSAKLHKLLSHVAHIILQSFVMRFLHCNEFRLHAFARQTILSNVSNCILCGWNRLWKIIQVILYENTNLVRTLIGRLVYKPIYFLKFTNEDKTFSICWLNIPLNLLCNV